MSDDIDETSVIHLDEATPEAVRQAIADHFGVDPDHVVIPDDVIRQMNSPPEPPPIPNAMTRDEAFRVRALEEAKNIALSLTSMSNGQSKTTPYDILALAYRIHDWLADGNRGTPEPRNVLPMSRE